MFGDTNANPDVDLGCMKSVVNSRKQRKIEAYMNNCIFEKLMNDLKLHEIKPELINGRLPKTYSDETYGTRIDRVFINIQKEEAFISVTEMRVRAFCEIEKEKLSGELEEFRGKMELFQE